jgi:hypothetical protein
MQSQDKGGSMNNQGRLSDIEECPDCKNNFSLSSFSAIVDREGTILYFGGRECECGYLEIAGRRVQDGNDDTQSA